jgi:tetratricopeptide (TPR) repeat protein
MGKKSKSPRKNTRQQTEPAQQEINPLIDAFNHGQYAEMEKLAQKMTVRFPNFALGWNGMGTAILKQQRYADALLPLQRAVILQPQDPQARNNLGNVLKKLHRYTEAENHYRHALKLTPNLAEAHYNLGNVLKQQERYTEAESSYRKTLALNPTLVSAHNNLASALLNQGRFNEAEASYQQALKIDPQCDEAILELGHLQMDKGDMTEAEVLFRKVLAFNPDNLSARYHLAQLKKTQPDDENFLALITAEKQIQGSDTPLPEGMAVALHFALGKSYGDIGEHAQAFPHYIEGGKLKRAALKHDSDQNTQHFNHIMNVFDSATLTRLSGGGTTSSVPVFIVGMPRSGTTLTEQIIASHPNVHGAGELSHLMSIVKSNTSYPDNVSKLNPAELTTWAKSYIKALQQHDPSAHHITDKMPGNFIAIGLIHLMLPNAKIIHVSRHPLDNCISYFTQLFEDGHAYSYDLSELGHYYADYARLMEHWRKVLPSNAFFDVRYEDIVADKETQARRLIEYCGLEWNDACLDFHKNKRSIHTASVTQVRQPIYTSSVARWKSYEKFLEPLIDALGDSIQKFESRH